MKILHYAIIVVMIVTVFFGMHYVFAQSNNTQIQNGVSPANSTCTDSIIQDIKTKYASFDEERAKTEAVNYEVFKSEVKNDKYIFRAVSQEWANNQVKCDVTFKSVLVLFIVTDSSGKDRDVTVLVNPESYKPQGIDVRYDVPTHGGNIPNLGGPVMAGNSTGTTSKITPAPQYPIWNYPVDGQVTSVDMSKDGTLVVAGTKSGTEHGTIYFLAKNDTLLWSHTFDRDICCVAMSADGSRVLVGGYQLVGGGVGTYGGAQSYENGQIYYFSNNGTLLWSYDFGVSPVMSIAMSPDGSIVGAGTDNEILYFDEHGQVLPNHSDGNIVWNHTGPSNLEKYSQNNTYTVHGEWAAAGHTVKFFDKGGNLLWYYDADITSSVAISSSGNYVAVGTGSLQDSNNVYFFNGAHETKSQSLEYQSPQSQIQVENAIQRNQDQQSQSLIMLEIGIPIFVIISALLFWFTRIRK